MKPNSCFEPQSSTRDAWLLLCIAGALYIATSLAFQKFSILGGVFAAQVISFLIPSLLYAKWKASSVRDALRLRPVAVAIMLRVALLAFTGIAIGDLINQTARPLTFRYFADWIPAMEACMQIFTPKTPGGLMGNLFVVGITGPICEELIFRGSFQGTLERHGAAPAIAVSAIVFGLIHLNPLNFLGPVFFGVALGFVAWRTGSILPAILWHGINNSAATLWFYLDGSSHSLPLWLDGGLAVLFGLVLLEFMRYTRHAVPAPGPLAAAPAALQGRAFRGLTAAGYVCVLLLLTGVTFFGWVKLGSDLLAPEYRAEDIVVYTRGLIIPLQQLRVGNVIIYQAGKGGSRFSRIRSIDGEKVTLIGPARSDGSLIEPAIQKKDIIGKVVWKFDPGNEIKQLFRQMDAKRSGKSAQANQ